jgi:diguanylate cyclase (GGDEF)-like protein/PAS domain S-box-containing protein
LVVEDEHIVAEDIKRHLQRLGYGIAGWASSADEAIEKAETTHPDLVLMDIMLKNGADGVQAAETIAERQRIPVVYLTAYSDHVTVQRAKTTAPFGYVLKPFEGRDLHITIEMALYKAQMERRLRESEQWLSTTLQCINDGVITTNSRGVVTFLNPVAQALTGWSADSALQRPIDEVMKLDDGENRSSANSLMQVLRQGAMIKSETPIRLTARDGTELPIEYSAAPIRVEADGSVGMVVAFRDATARTSQIAALEYQGLHDPVTGLPNRVLFYDRLQQAVLVGYRQRLPVAVLVLELAGLQSPTHATAGYVNDLVLQQVGQRLWDALRKSDTVARLGDSRFAVLLPGVRTVAAATRAIERILRAVDIPIAIPGGNPVVDAKIGVALCPLHAEDAQGLMACAETALRNAKRNGGSFAVFTPDADAVNRR